MDARQAGVHPPERGDQPPVRPVVDVDQPEVVVLAIAAPAAAMVVVLEPVSTDDLRLAREARGGGGRTARPLGLRRHRHQVAVVAVPGAVLVRGEEHSETRTACRRRARAGRRSSSARSSHRAVDVVVGGDGVDHGAMARTAAGS